MPVNDELGRRMKDFYETIPKTKLMRRTPVAIRIDGKAFHTFTRGMKRPFDDILIETMQQTMKYLCENIQGCVLGYTQSDEITLILIDYQKLTSCAWFDYEVQKMCSVAASMATMAFNRLFRENFNKYDLDNQLDYAKTLFNKLDSAMFDARCFNIPKEEVANLIYWRQLDATRNSIQMVGQANFSQRELHGKSCNKIQDMLMLEKNINWNDFPAYQKRGSCCIKQEYAYPDEFMQTQQWSTRWIIDKDIPIFKNEDRKYIEDLIYVGE